MPFFLSVLLVAERIRMIPTCFKRRNEHVLKHAMCSVIHDANNSVGIGNGYAGIRM